MFSWSWTRRYWRASITTSIQGRYAHITSVSDICFCIYHVKNVYSIVEYKKAELDDICSLVNSYTLNALLEEDTLLDTNVIYYYLDVFRHECPDAYLPDPSICLSHIDTH